MMSPPVLLVRDVARIWTEERRRRTPHAAPVQPATVWSYRKESVRAGGRYRHDPMPAPDGYLGIAPYWNTTREQELRTWWTGRARRREQKRSTNV